MLKKRLECKWNSISQGDRKNLDSDLAGMLSVLSDASEFDELPVRHNEDLSNVNLASVVSRKNVDSFGGLSPNEQPENPHFKAFLLFQCHLTRNVKLPNTDYITDTTTVLDQSIRVIQAMIDIAASQGFLNTTLAVMLTLQCIKQACWPSEPDLICLPHMNQNLINDLKALSITCVSDLLKKTKFDSIRQKLNNLSSKQISDISNVISSLPIISISSVTIVDSDSNPCEKNDKGWILKSDLIYNIKLEVTRKTIEKQNSNQREISLYCPYFPKAQTESWWVVFGDSVSNELLVLKRCQLSLKSIIVLEFMPPEKPGDYSLDVNVVSDGYRGRDFVLKIPVKVYE